ncbi:hypothetical protein SeseC_00209 [Streptococcus equi subsp. zooepidemicus ATCC 35246]|nr:hypothetical protein SeseC_00209 [Streptococcus equi subsp. zooepidemicus ATCC 35246]
MTSYNSFGTLYHILGASDTHTVIVQSYCLFEGMTSQGFFDKMIGL